MPTNVRHAIMASSITILDEVIEKSYEMEENMLESNVDLKFILDRVQRQMTSLSINPKRGFLSRNGESLGTTRGLFYGNPPNVRNTPDAAQIRREQESLSERT